MLVGCWERLITDPIGNRSMQLLPQPPKFPGGISSEANDFLSKCLIIDPDARLKASELLQHPVRIFHNNVTSWKSRDNTPQTHQLCVSFFCCVRERKLRLGTSCFVAHCRIFR